MYQTFLNIILSSCHYSLCMYVCYVYFNKDQSINKFYCCIAASEKCQTRYKKNHCRHLRCRLLFSNNAFPIRNSEDPCDFDLDLRSFFPKTGVQTIRARENIFTKFEVSMTFRSRLTDRNGIKTERQARTAPLRNTSL